MLFILLTHLIYIITMAFTCLYLASSFFPQVIWDEAVLQELGGWDLESDKLG